MPTVRRQWDVVEPVNAPIELLLMATIYVLMHFRLLAFASPSNGHVAPVFDVRRGTRLGGTKRLQQCFQ